jgi:putative hemolysin
VVTVALTSRYGAHGELMAMVLMSLLIIVLGEILPKSFFREYPERLTWAAAPFLRATQLLLLPVLLLLRLYTRLWSRLLPAHEAESGALDRQTLATLFLAHTPPGGQDARFRAILDRYLHLSELDLRALMHPLATVRAVRMQATVAACMQESETSGFSRLPVLDAGGRLQGWLLARDLLFLPDGVGRDDPLPPSLVRTPLLVDAGMSPFELFEELHAQGYEMAFVTDEGGEVLGMATREDLVEAIVGSIRDEFDRSRDESRAAPMGRDPGWLSS